MPQVRLARGLAARTSRRRRYDLVVCHDVLQYLDDAGAARALVNLARLARGALYFSVLTRRDWRQAADQSRTDRDVHLRSADWYQRRLRRALPPRRLRRARGAAAAADPVGTRGALALARAGSCGRLAGVPRACSSRR